MVKEMTITLRVHGNDGACAYVHGDLALGEFAVGQFRGQMVNVQDQPVKHMFAPDDGFQNTFVASIVHDTHLQNMELP